MNTAQQPHISADIMCCMFSTQHLQLVFVNCDAVKNNQYCHCADDYANIVSSKAQFTDFAELCHLLHPSVYSST